MFHRELYKFYHKSECLLDIDHIDGIDIDDVDENLNIVSCSQNWRNIFTRGYVISANLNAFRPKLKIRYQNYYPFRQVKKNEAEACILQNEAEQVWLREQLGDQYYMFDFKKYRRGSEDLLDLERTGQISEEEAIYRHIMRYADNAWYMLRYGLEDYYKENHISIPAYALDSDGFMVHPITGKRLCPFAK